MATRTCTICGREFTGVRAQFCSSNCRTRASATGRTLRALETAGPAQPDHVGIVIEPSPVGAPESVGPGEMWERESALVEATRTELKEAGRLDTVLGQAALELARRISSPMETGSAIAALVRQLRDTLAAATAGAEGVSDPLDELRARRDAKRAN